MYPYVKRIIDILLASGALLLLSPLLAVLALLILLDDGAPVFFVQARPGRDLRPFPMLKFRSMIRDADKLLAAGGRPTGARVTRMGKFLRAWSLDELPQLFNVLRGEMSIVGPRPMLSSWVERLEDGQMERFNVRPGITGLAQVSGRNTIPWSRRLELDREYVRNVGFGLDLRILLRTAGVVLFRQGFVMDRNPESADDLGGASAETPGSDTGNPTQNTDTTG